jgi:hypothetical protein
MLFGGAYAIETPALQKIRSYITKNHKAFVAAATDPVFVEKYTQLQGEQNKRLPEEFAAFATKEPLIANKQFYYSAELKPDILLIEKLPETLMEFYQAGRRVNTFLKAALK